MKVTVLRGRERVGENLIEVTDGKTKILLECGVALTPTPEGNLAEKQVTQTHYDGVIITHHHLDHSGLLRYPICAKAIYMGKITRDILLQDGGICQENRDKIRILQSETPFFIGAIEIIPHLCDHSAMDSYMLELNADERILYTGDFRSSGRKSFFALLKRLPTNIDLLITEGTNLGRGYLAETECTVEEKTVELCKKAKKVFVLQSRLNVDRTVTFYRAAKRSKRSFLQTLSSSAVCELTENIPNPITFSDCYTYLSVGESEEKHEQIFARYGKKLLSKYQIARKRNIIMQVHSGMLGYFRELSKLCDLSGSLLVYSLWNGYEPKMREFLEGVSALGVEVVRLHASGHADEKAINLLRKRVNAKREILVHCDIEGIS